MSPFCEPVMTTSSPHASVLHSTAPMPVIESTMSTTSSSGPTILPMASTSLSTPVDVSDCVTMTPRASGFAASAAATSAGRTTSVQPYCRSTTLSPYVSAMSFWRSPNLPLRHTMTVSPAEKQFAMPASITPVPEHANSSTSPSVWKTYLRLTIASANAAEKSGVRWWMIGAAMVSMTFSGTGVGPGVIRYFFCILRLPYGSNGSLRMSFRFRRPS